MFERCLNEAERVLEVHRDEAVPVKEIWERVSGVAATVGFEVPTLADFSALLEGDKRFEMIAAHEDATGGTSLLPGEEGDEEAEMEKLGFFPEDRVRLRRFAVRREPESDDEEIVSLPVATPSRTPKKPAAAPKRSASRRAATPKPKKKAAPASKRRTPARRTPKRTPPRTPVRRVARRRPSARRGRKK